MYLGMAKEFAPKSLGSADELVASKIKQKQKSSDWWNTSPNERKARGYGKGGEIYQVEYWETEEDRDMGEGNMYMLSEEEQVSKEKAIQRAKNLFSKQNFASVEVLDEDGSVVFYISNDEPNGESYAKGGKLGKNKPYNVDVYFEDKQGNEYSEDRIDVVAKSKAEIKENINKVVSKRRGVDLSDKKHKKVRVVITELSLDEVGWEQADADAQKSIEDYAKGGEVEYYDNGEPKLDMMEKAYLLQPLDLSLIHI